jgi:hypothetical protein
VTEHVTDDLELYAVGALRQGEADRVALHLALCPACREELAEISTVVNALPDMVASREPPAGLRERILATAAADLPPAAPVPSGRAARGVRSWVGTGALLAAVLLLLAVDVNSLRQLGTANEERAVYASILEKVSHGGRTWYMSGLDQWRGSGGTLFAPGKPDSTAFVVFHDLQKLQRGAVYAIWLVDADGHWVRAASFTPDGDAAVRGVDLTVPVDAFSQCAVTVEMATEGKRAGPLVMQSRIAAPGQ